MVFVKSLRFVVSFFALDREAAPKVKKKINLKVVFALVQNIILFLSLLFLDKK